MSTRSTCAFGLVGLCVVAALACNLPTRRRVSLQATPSFEQVFLAPTRALAATPTPGALFRVYLPVVLSAPDPGDSAAAIPPCPAAVSSTAQPGPGGIPSAEAGCP